jgi:hypothetical protein
MTRGRRRRASQLRARQRTGMAIARQAQGKDTRGLPRSLPLRRKCDEDKPSHYRTTTGHSPCRPASNRFKLKNRIFRILRYHIRATGALHGSGAISSCSTCASLISATGALAGSGASIIRATLAFGADASDSGPLLRFRPGYALPGSGASSSGASPSGASASGGLLPFGPPFSFPFAFTCLAFIGHCAYVGLP